MWRGKDSDVVGSILRMTSSRAPEMLIERTRQSLKTRSMAHPLLPWELDAESCGYIHIVDPSD